VTQIEVSLSDQTESELRRLVEQGEFINRDQAVEKLLSRGLSAYQTTEEEPLSEMDENMFDQMTDEQQDPALQDEGTGDDYTF
jgi:Arc/MetJ-type ribon-helix-helix transcriptional regulator